MKESSLAILTSRTLQLLCGELLNDAKSACTPSESACFRTQDALSLHLRLRESAN
jgi:hypothetical protein